MRLLQDEAAAENTTTNATTSNPLTTMPLFMGLIYGVMSFLIFIYSLLFFYFKRREDSDPNKLAGEGCY